MSDEPEKVPTVDPSNASYKVHVHHQRGSAARATASPRIRRKDHTSRSAPAAVGADAQRAHTIAPALATGAQASEPDMSPVVSLDPTVAQWLSGGAPDQRVDVIFSSLDDEEVAPLPAMDLNEARDGPVNALQRERAAAAAKEHAETRRDRHASFAARLREHGATVEPSFGVTDFVAVSVTIDGLRAIVDEIATHSDFPHRVDARLVDAAPPGGAVALAGPDVGASAIGLDHFLLAGFSGQSIALIDMGVNPDHPVFATSPVTIGLRDCTHSDDLCRTTPAADGHDNGSHGTASAGTLAQIAALAVGTDAGKRPPGLHIESFKVDYKGAGLDQATAARAIARAAVERFPVILVELQPPTGANSLIAKAANDAFDAGSVVIAANGNTAGRRRLPSGKWQEHGGTLCAPAVAQRAVGVGATHWRTKRRDTTSTFGRDGGRLKPELMALTGFNAPSNGGDEYSAFLQTSGAAPYVAAAAASIRQWLWHHARVVDPGHVYAWLMMCGLSPFHQTKGFNEKQGCGLLSLPTTGSVWWGKVEADAAVEIELPIDVDTATAGMLLRGAIWWPERRGQPHTPVAMRILDPSGAVCSVSQDPETVFQRADARIKRRAGLWTIRLDVDTAPVAPQTIYWAAHVGGPASGSLGLELATGLPA